MEIRTRPVIKLFLELCIISFKVLSIIMRAKVRPNGQIHEYGVNIRKCEPMYTTTRSLCSLVDTHDASRPRSGILMAVSDWSGNCSDVIAMGPKGVR
jgi:hypothetical protein